MKKIRLLLCVSLLFIFVFSLSACVDYGYEREISYNGTRFWFVPHKSESGKDYYYIAQELENKTVKDYFMPMFVNGLPVRSYGSSGFNTCYTKLDFFLLQKLYMPGTIIEKVGTGKFIDNIHQDMQIYYCGGVIDLYGTYPYECDYMIDYYVPADKFDEFQDIFASNSAKTPTSSRLYRANVTYRLNCEDMCEYYYVDNIEAGNKIQNIPPEPTRKGYKFAGWYTEKECVNKWDFDNVPTVSNNDDDSFVEFALYAKWTKKLF